VAPLAYVGTAVMAEPDMRSVLSLVPSVHLDKDFLSIMVAIIGTSLSAYLPADPARSSRQRARQFVHFLIDDGTAR
jgi:hypothetical protein